MVLWQLITSQKPYGNLGDMQVLLAVGMGSIQLAIPVSIPDSIRSLLQSCLERNYRQRPYFPQIVSVLDEVQSSTDAMLDAEFHQLQLEWQREISTGN